jgi:hypothetical protein
MSNYRIIIDVKDVTEGDITGVAQEIWDAHADELDAKLGDFEIGVFYVEGNFSRTVDWEPQS